MNADSSLRVEMFPRGMLVASGEDIPNGHSCRARMMVCEVARGDVNLDVLTELQTAAGAGVLKAAMAAYLKHVAGQDKSKLKTRFLELRQEAMKRIAVGHTRTPENIALMMLGIENFSDFAGTEVDAAKLREEAWTALIVAGEKQDQHQKDEQPAERFKTLLRGIFASGRAHIRDAQTGYAPDLYADRLGWIEKMCQVEVNGKWEILATARGEAIGWMEKIIDFDKDGFDLYLEPEATYAALRQFSVEQGHPMPWSKTALWKALNEAGLLESIDTAPEEDRQPRLTVRKTIYRQRTRVLHVNAEKVLEIDFAPTAPKADAGLTSDRLAIPTDLMWGWTDPPLGPTWTDLGHGWTDYLAELLD
jgi:hypothetical protein